MTLPRSKYVQEGQDGVYHCYSRCVRRAFLCGFDAHTGRDFSHRKAWLVDRLRFLASIFAIDVCAYAVLQNHYHVILRICLEIAAAWSDREVAIRWLTLFPIQHRPPSEAQISALADCPERIAVLRKRLCSLSWFMGRLNEFIARAANKEDNVKGRFWESRFKCQALLDEAATAACMVYVDLNLIRARLAPTPEESDFTSIQERIRAWQNEMTSKALITSELTQQDPNGPSAENMPVSEDKRGIPGSIPEAIPVGSLYPSSLWLCPIQSDTHRRGILQMTEADYFNLVDQSGRLLRAGKRGAIDPQLAPILLRIGANPQAWIDTISRFGPKFRLAAGLISSLRDFADKLGRRWLVGISAARIAFASTSP
jgi:putative transposase